MRATLILIVLIAAVSLGAAPTAFAELVVIQGCSVSINDQVQSATCTFKCQKGEKVVATANSQGGTVTTSGDCETSGITCEDSSDDEQSSRCTAAAEATAGGEGVCQVAGAKGGGRDLGTGGCGTTCDNSTCAPPPPCLLKLLGLCILEGTGNVCTDEKLRQILPSQTVVELAEGEECASEEDLPSDPARIAEATPSTAPRGA